MGKNTISSCRTPGDLVSTPVWAMGMYSVDNDNPKFTIEDHARSGFPGLAPSLTQKVL